MTVRRAWVGAGGAALCLVGAAALAAAGRPPSEVAMAVALAFVPYALLLAGDGSGSPAGDAHLARVALGLACVAGLALVLAPPALSDDLYRYLWDARVLRHGIDPYRYAPTDPALASLRDGLHARINHPAIPTIYPPLAQGVFLMADLLAHAPWSIKLLALGAHLGTALVVGRLAVARQSRAVALYALNPLALSASALGGHIDAVAALAVAAFLLALLSRRSVLAAVLAGAASGLKLIGIALAPLVLGARRRAGVLALLLALLPVVPLVGAGWGSDATSGLGNYTRRWKGNAGGFLVVEAGTRAAMHALGGLSGAPPGHVHLSWLAPLLRRAEGTPFDPRAGVVPEQARRGDIADFDADFAGSLLARALVAAAVLALAFVLGWRRTDPLVATRAVLWALLLLSPQVHPWYLLWLLPVEVAAGKGAGVVWSAAVLVAYAPLDRWVAAHRWVESPWGPALEYGVVLAALLLEAGPRRGVRGSTPAHL